MISGGGIWGKIRGKIKGGFKKAGKLGGLLTKASPWAALAGGLFAGGKKLLGGGGGTTGYESPYTKEYEEKLRGGIYGRLDKPSPFTETYKSAYKPTTFASSYAPTATYKKPTFAFEALPEKYAEEEYALGAKPIQREGASSLERVRETVGTRRPGLLLKTAEQSQRDVSERLAGLQSQLRLGAAKQKVGLGVQQQLAQDEAEFRSAGFNEDQSRQLANEKYRESEFGEEQARFGAGEGAKEYASRAELEAKKREDEAQTLDYLERLFSKTGGFEGKAAGRRLTKRGQTLDFLSNLGKTFKGGG